MCLVQLITAPTSVTQGLGNPYVGWQLQEAGRRAGTENVLGIVGLGAAAEIVNTEQEASARHMAAMRDDLQDRLLRVFPQVLPVHVLLLRCTEETDLYVCRCCGLFFQSMLPFSACTVACILLRY